MSGAMNEKLSSINESIIKNAIRFTIVRIRGIETPLLNEDVEKIYNAWVSANRHKFVIKNLI